MGDDRSEAIVQTSDIDIDAKDARALAILLNALGKEEITINDKPVSRMTQLGSIVWEFLLDGKIVFPDGHTLIPSASEWGRMIRWFFIHLDGPVRLPSPQQPVNASATSIVQVVEVVRGIDHGRPILDSDIVEGQVKKQMKASEVARKIAETTVDQE